MLTGAALLVGGLIGYVLVPRVIEKKVPLFALDEFTDIQIEPEGVFEVTRKILQQYQEIPEIVLIPNIERPSL